EEDSLPSSIELQKTKKEAQEMQKALEEAKEDFKERMEVINHRWRDLRGRQAQLKAYIETSGKTLKEHDGMRILALKIARKEREKKMQKESELVRAKESLEALKKQHQQLRDKVQKFSIFKEYLEDVVKVSQFEDIQELIEHYKMMVTRKDQLQSQQKHEEMSEQGQVLLNQHTAEKAAEIEQLKNELKDLQLRYDQAQKDVLQW
ncbi:CCD42 protein, partial [Piaya cayana]|nr:CCD42 protein [Piaya cayana]